MANRAHFLLMLVVCGAAVSLAARAPAPYDLLVKNATVIDGSGKAGVKADVAVKDGVIVRVGRLPGASATTVIDAAGKVVAPGFIDVHTHADDIAERAAAENFVRLGVTTVIAGNCGDGASDVGAALGQVRQTGVTINFGTLYGHGTAREAVMGSERRPPTPDEMEKMKALVRKAMDDGAFGISTGLEYVPGSYAETSELIELTKVAASAGGLYATHMRNEGTEVEKSVTEAIAIGEAAHCPVEISHLKIDAPRRWGMSKTVLAMIDQARRRGVNVRADQYAYDSSASGLSIRVPAWALEGDRQKVAARLKDEATWQQIKGEMQAMLAARGLNDLSFGKVTSYRADPSLNGLTMKEIAAKVKGADDAEAQFAVAREMLINGGAGMVYRVMGDEDIARIMRHPQVSVASDAGILRQGEGVPHPRGYGNNARVLGHYVRDLEVITLAEAIRKMTSLPARQFGIADRGLIKAGFAADLVVFDPATVADQATYEKPHQFPVGIPWVVVNGSVVLQNGEMTAARPGQVLTKKAAKPRRTTARSGLLTDVGDGGKSDH